MGNLEQTKIQKKKRKLGIEENGEKNCEQIKKIKNKKKLRRR